MIDTKSLAWAAGFLEGEGHFGMSGGSAMVSATQASMQPLERLQGLFGGAVGKGSTSKITKKQMYRWTLSGPQATGLMMTLYSVMSSRHDQVKRALDKWKGRAVSTKYRSVCNRGHAYTPENTYHYGPNKGYPWRARYCRKCLEDKHILKVRV